ncbi:MULTISPECIES: DUF4148 domain-containing protein [unclassified Caballeronia]|uniref:DUF4148 domain-containing protein n=1 Tax=unclassified Caballeronia TaxID=2646786 RepID=UPI00285C0204|nr:MULTISPECIES: DUF4148 domain-containing protein [unclassified Caballeronia]MDR5751308.1 DUF4148 domain-containing protein [Caballeronia sp. LZ024]MDR5844554.1 DUF4148 domain-containing protein [Caballeronia sp. LZ031]
MKSLQAVVIVAVLATPLASFAQQSNAPVTRAQVRAELVQLEKAGYNPAKRDNTTYPSDVQAAEARIAAGNPSTQAATQGVGGVTSGATQSGHRTSGSTASRSMYGHH